MEQETKEIIERKELSEKDINLLISVNVLPKDISKEMVEFFMAFCKQTNLNPFKRQVYIVPRFSKTKGMTYTIQTGIDGYRAIADRTGVCAGIDDPVYDNEKKPEKATVIVYKMVNGVRCPFVASARWNHYYPSNENAQFMWNKMPHLMLGKCAEALALRKAFPNELSGTYTDEEMQQADVIDIKSQIEETPKKQETSPKETNGENKISPTSNNCVDCGKVISNPRVIEYSKTNFNAVVCFECQADRRNKVEEKDEYSEAEYQEEII